MEYKNDSSILHESCLFNNSLSEAINSNNDEILPNLSVCSNDFLEAQISLTEQTARIETSDFEYVHNIQLPANTSKEVWFKNKGMHIMHLNIHYLYSKLDEIKILLSQQPNIDILCCCESFLNDQGPRMKSYSICLDFKRLCLGPCIINRDTDRHRRCLGVASMISRVNTKVTWLVY